MNIVVVVQKKLKVMNRMYFRLRVYVVLLKVSDRFVLLMRKIGKSRSITIE